MADQPSFYITEKNAIVHTIVVNMVRIEHFTNIDTSIDNLYNSIKEELSKDKKNLKIGSEIIGEMNELLLRVLQQ